MRQQFRLGFLLRLLCAVMAFLAAGPPSMAQEIFSADFESGAGPEWSKRITETTPAGGRRFLGRFGNEAVRLSLSDLPAHTQLTVTFELYVIGTWDGNNPLYGPDPWEMRVAGGHRIIRTTFSNVDSPDYPQSFPGTYPEAEYRAFFRAAEWRTLGYFTYTVAGTLDNSAVYRVTATIPHSEASIALDFAKLAGSFYGGIEDESWGIDNVRVSVPQSTDVDRDGDGLPDEWEESGYWYGDRFVNLKEMGANPDHKDVFIYVDWLKDATHSHRLSNKVLERVIAAFANAPVPNPDGNQGITLHITQAENGIEESPGRQEIGFQDTGTGNYNWSEFHEIKQSSFPLAFSPSFHYCLVGHFGSRSSTGDWSGGISRGIPGSDFLVTLGGGKNQVGTLSEQAGTFMHELGHNFGLGHGGSVRFGLKQANTNRKPNYLSVMNYSFSHGLIKGWQDDHLDYSRFSLPSLDERRLDERKGLLGGAELASYRTWWYFGGTSLPGNPHLALSSDRINWNWNTILGQSYYENDVTADINGDGEWTELTSNNDWEALEYAVGLIGWIGSVQSNGMPLLPDVTLADEPDATSIRARVPISPSGLSARASTGAVRLAWAPTGSAEDRRYRVYRSVGGAPFQVRTTTAVALYAESGLPPGLAVRYYVTALTPYDVESEPSEVVASQVR